MSTDAFDKVSGIVGGAMRKAWIDIIDNLANTAKGGAPTSALKLTGPVPLTVDDLKDFFAIAGGANLSIDFPCVLPKTKVDHFRAKAIEHGVAPAGKISALGISGEISIGIGIRF